MTTKLPFSPRLADGARSARARRSVALLVYAAAALAACGQPAPAGAPAPPTTPATRADALKLVRSVYDPYTSTAGNGSRLLGTCFIHPSCPPQLAAKVTPALAASLRRHAARNEGDPVICAQNTPGRVSYETAGAAHDSATFTVHTYYSGSGDNLISVTVDLRTRRLTRVTCATPPTISGAASSRAGTHVTTWSPFAADGRLRSDLRVARRAGGSCVGTANAPVAMPAQRCFAGNEILDPCFEPPTGIDQRDPVVVCAAAPWKHTVTQFALKAAPPRSQPQAYPRTPWALQLTSGERCTFQQGAGGANGARRLNYACGQNPPYVYGPYLFGDVDRARPTWRIHAARDAEHPLHNVTIAHAWR